MRTVCVGSLHEWRPMHGDCNPENSDTDHCVQVIGFDTATTTPYWKIRDSWTTGRSEAELIS